jgi:tRNA uracil 4-sulfurtransferase
MHNIIIIRYGEIALKGKNRINFERKLIQNIRDCLIKNNIEFEKIMRERGRIFIETSKKCVELSNVFGITSYSYATKNKFNEETIKENLKELLKNKKFETFRVTTNRADKTIPKKSMELNILFGSYVVEEFNKKVSLTKFDLEVGIEILLGHSYVYVDQIKGPGGLCYGVNGNVFILVENEKSFLAAWMLMKRGLKVVPISTQKQDISLLEKYNYGYNKLDLIILKNNEEIEQKAQEVHINSIIIGSTFEDIEKYKFKMLILRPLIGLSDDEIESKLKTL